MLDDNFSSVIKKYYNRWHNKKYKNAFNTNLKNTLVKSIKLSEVEQKLNEIENLPFKEFVDIFIELSPYEKEVTMKRVRLPKLFSYSDSYTKRDGLLNGKHEAFAGHCPP